MFLLHLLLAVQAQAATPAAKSDTRLDQAFSALEQRRPADAVRLAGEVAAELERAHPRSKTHCIFSADDLGRALIYSVTATKMGCKSSAVVGGDFAEAYFVKGFGLYDLGRFDEAIKAYSEAIALSPMAPQYWLERAECYKALGDWDKAFKDFEAAANNAPLGDLDNETVKADHLARAYRGMAFVKVEQNDLRKARKFLEKASAAKPDDPRTKEDLADLAQRERR